MSIRGRSKGKRQARLDTKAASSAFDAGQRVKVIAEGHCFAGYEGVVLPAVGPDGEIGVKLDAKAHQGAKFFKASQLAAL